MELGKSQSIFHEISIETKDDYLEESIATLKEVKINIGNANITIPVSETTLIVINDNGKDSKSKKYMWLYMSNTSFKPVLLYDYQSTRSNSCPKNFVGDFQGFLQTDGYNGYNFVSGATRVYCLAHIRRYFHNIIVDLDKEALKNSRGVIGFNYCEQIYKLEKELREVHLNDENYYDISFKERAERLAPIIDNFIEYVEREIKDDLPRSPLGKALDYAKKHLPGLKNVLLDGSLEVDNNLAERDIKPFVIGRKTFYLPILLMGQLLVLIFIVLLKLPRQIIW